MPSDTMFTEACAGIVRMLRLLPPEAELRISCCFARRECSADKRNIRYDYVSCVVYDMLKRDSNLPCGLSVLLLASAISHLITMKGCFDFEWHSCVGLLDSCKLDAEA